MGDQYYVEDGYDEETDMDELEGYMSPDEGDGDLAGFERPEMKVDFSTAVVVSNLPQVSTLAVSITACTSMLVLMTFWSSKLLWYSEVDKILGTMGALNVS